MQLFCIWGNRFWVLPNAMTLFTGKSYHHNTCTVKNALEKANLYCEQNRNKIGQTSKFMFIFIKSYYCRMLLNTTKFWDIHHRTNFYLKLWNKKSIGNLKLCKTVVKFVNLRNLFILSCRMFFLQIFFILTILAEKFFHLQD